MKARTVVGRGEKDPLCDPGSELLLGGSARVVRTKTKNGMKNKRKRVDFPSTILAKRGKHACSIENYCLR